MLFYNSRSKSFPNNTYFLKHTNNPEKLFVLKPIELSLSGQVRTRQQQTVSFKTQTLTSSGCLMKNGAARKSVS